MTTPLQREIPKEKRKTRTRTQRKNEKTDEEAEEQALLSIQYGPSEQAEALRGRIRGQRLTWPTG